jgi:single-strand DNA-binding protein
MKVATFGLATNRVWMKDGVRQESADYHNIVVFGRQAETTAQYLKKGSQALVEGRIQTRGWEGNDGQKRYRTEIIAERVQFGSRPGGKAGTKTGDTESKALNDEIDTIEYPEDEINPDDIPF